MKRLLCALVLFAIAAPAGADYGSGCPMIVRPGMKLAKPEHEGQWFSASYSLGICGEDESDATWTVEPVPAVYDTCWNAADWALTGSMGEKSCDRRRGKVLWIGTPGTYKITAHAPDGAGSWTIEGFVVD
jgi:hypothetical protein